jgi:hypothetical protein
MIYNVLGYTKVEFLSDFPRSHSTIIWSSIVFCEHRLLRTRSGNDWEKLSRLLFLDYKFCNH